MNYIFNLMGIPIKEAHNIKFKDNEDGTFQLWFTAPFYDKRIDKTKDMRIHILKLEIDPIPLLSMLSNENGILYTITEEKNE